jgi:hypothetical protein
MAGTVLGAEIENDHGHRFTRVAVGACLGLAKFNGTVLIANEQ